MFIQEMWANNDTLLFEMPGDYTTAISVNATRDMQLAFAQLENIKYTMLYGPDGNNGIVSAQIPAVNQLLEQGTCINGDLSTNPILARGLGINGDITPVFDQCLPSLKSLWSHSDVV